MTDKPWPAADEMSIVVEAVENLYRGFYAIDHYRVRVPRFEGGSMTVRRELLERGTSVCVLPYDPKTDKVLLIRQFLIGSHVAGQAPCPLQVITGIVEAGDENEATARREAMEEAGCLLHRIMRAQAYLASPGGSSERVVAFIGEADLDRVGGVHGAAKEEEDIKVEVVPVDEALALLDMGHIESASAVILLSWLARHRVKMRREWS